MSPALGVGIGIAIMSDADVCHYPLISETLGTPREYHFLCKEGNITITFKLLSLFPRLIVTESLNVVCSSLTVTACNHSLRKEPAHGTLNGSG